MFITIWMGKNSASTSYPRCSMVLEYLPTFTPKMAQFCMQINQHHGAYGYISTYIYIYNHIYHISNIIYQIFDIWYIYIYFIYHIWFITARSQWTRPHSHPAPHPTRLELDVAARPRGVEDPAVRFKAFEATARGERLARRLDAENIYLKKPAIPIIYG